MTQPGRDAAILTIVLYAALADGGKHKADREEFRRVADSLPGQGYGPDVRRIYQDVLHKWVLLEAASMAVGHVSRNATGMAFSFASTYAPGQVTKCYYAGSSKMD